MEYIVEAYNAANILCCFRREGLPLVEAMDVAQGWLERGYHRVEISLVK